MSWSKYIVIESELGNECIVVFPDQLTHAEIGHRKAVVSAGFISFVDDGKAVCFGKSTSLGLEARPEEDSRLANKQLLRRAA